MSSGYVSAGIPVTPGTPTPSFAGANMPATQPSSMPSWFSSHGYQFPSANPFVMPPDGSPRITLPGSPASSAQMQFSYPPQIAQSRTTDRGASSSTLAAAQPNANATIATLASSIADLTTSLRTVTADMSRLYAELQQERNRNAELMARLESAMAPAPATAAP